VIFHGASAGANDDGSSFDFNRCNPIRSCYDLRMKTLIVLSLVLLFSSSAFAQRHHHHHRHHHHYRAQ
jgi:hypothetical protein